MLTIFILCLFSIALAQPPQPCTSPSQWEGRVYDTNEEQHMTIRGRLSYDAINHRSRFLEELDVGQTNTSYDIIRLFDTKIEYIYNFNTKNCTRQTLTRPWKNFGIPPNATSFGYAYIGSSWVPDGHLLLSLWASNYTAGNDSIREFGSWTVEHCIPANIIRHSQQYGRSQTTFLNIVPNITDPSVFTPRKECLTEEEYSLRDILFGKS